jgi:acetyl-CoA C-acetyltransferase
MNEKIDVADVDYIIIRHVVPVGCRQEPSRQVALSARLPESLSSITVNKVCCSGNKIPDLVVQMFQIGRAKIVMTKREESITNCPHVLSNMWWGCIWDCPELDILRDCPG